MFSFDKMYNQIPVLLIYRSTEYNFSVLKFFSFSFQNCYYFTNLMRKHENIIVCAK